MPTSVLKRADEILQSLELRRNLLSQGVDINASGDQLGLFGGGSPPPDGESEPAAADPVRDAIAGFDLDHSTPFDALQFLKSLKDQVDS